jgi:hypothetical protein
MRRLAVFALILLASAVPMGSGDASAQEEFIPSERIRADAAVSFPVDI